MSNQKLKIISETENYLVVYKPAGLLVHTAPGKTETTLVDLLIEHFPEIKNVGDDPIRPGIVHRLDQNVSGLLVVAKTQEIFEHLKAQFKNRETKKIYQALVFNWPKEDEGKIDLPIGRSGKGVKMSANCGKDLKPALTEYRVLEKYKWGKQGLALVEIKLHTGRTHQIRLHFQSQGHPLVGDDLYKIKRVKQPENFNRIFLQAVELGFKDLNGNEQKFKIDLDDELKEMLNSFELVAHKPSTIFSQKEKIVLGKNKIFIISGPSGAGEDSIIRGLKKILPIEKIITTTTRDKRVGEVDGVDYYFISKEEFETRLQDDKFFEYAKQYNDELYGVTFEEIERVKNLDKIGIWKIDYKGVINAKKLMPEVKSILITAPLEILEQRIRNRDKVTEDFVKQRMEYTREWLKHEDAYDFKVVNRQGKLDESIQQTLEIIKNN